VQPVQRPPRVVDKRKVRRDSPMILALAEGLRMRW
jgi:hypothetical protein